MTGMIAHIQTNREWGGGENQVFHLLQALQKRDIPVTLWAHPDGALLQRARAAGLATQALPTAALRKGPFRQTIALSKAMKDVALIHAHDSDGLDLAIHLKRRLRIPLVYNRRIASPIRSRYFSQRKYSTTYIDAVLAISETVRQAMIASSRYPAERIRIAPTGVDPACLESIEADPSWRERFGAESLAGGLGRLAPKKNWAFLVQTAAACKPHLPGLHWIVAGDGPERAALETLAAQWQVTDRVHFVGFQAEGTRLLKSLDLLFFPSLREGASVTIREAMMLGVPVAAMNAEGSVESLAGHGWILEPDQVDRAVAAVREILANPDRRHAVTQAARHSALARFTFDRTAEDTLTVYRQLLSAHRNDR